MQECQKSRETLQKMQNYYFFSVQIYVFINISSKREEQREREGVANHSSNPTQVWTCGHASPFIVHQELLLLHGAHTDRHTLTGHL